MPIAGLRMSLAQILDKVTDVTKRPDARSRALLSANSIIQDICNNADFPEDLVEVTLVNPTPDKANFTVSLAIPNSPPVRKIEILVANGKKIEYIKPRQAVSTSGCSPLNTYYRAGSNLNINADAAPPFVALSYYQQTGFLSESATHWLEAEAEHILILGICASVFRATGDDNSAQEYEGQYRLARQSFRRMRVDSEDL